MITKIFNISLNTAIIDLSHSTAILDIFLLLQQSLTSKHVGSHNNDIDIDISTFKEEILPSCVSVQVQDVPQSQEDPSDPEGQGREDPPLQTGVGQAEEDEEERGGEGGEGEGE